MHGDPFQIFFPRISIPPETPQTAPEQPPPDSKGGGGINTRCGIVFEDFRIAFPTKSKMLICSKPSEIVMNLMCYVLCLLCLPYALLDFQREPLKHRYTVAFWHFYRLWEPRGVLKWSQRHPGFKSSRSAAPCGVSYLAAHYCFSTRWQLLVYFLGPTFVCC